MKDFTAVYNDKGDKVAAWNFDALAGAGCLRSTANDLLQYAVANMGNDNTELNKAILLTHQPTFDKDRRVGLGWHYKKDSQWLWHTGGTGGSSSFIAFDTEKKIAIVVLSNCSIVVDDLAKELVDIVKQP